MKISLIVAVIILAVIGWTMVPRDRDSQDETEDTDEPYPRRVGKGSE